MILVFFGMSSPLNKYLVIETERIYIFNGTTTTMLCLLLTLNTHLQRKSQCLKGNDMCSKPGDKCLGEPCRFFFPHTCQNKVSADQYHVSYHGLKFRAGHFFYYFVNMMWEGQENLSVSVQYKYKYKCENNNNKNNNNNN